MSKSIFVIQIHPREGDDGAGWSPDWGCSPEPTRGEAAGYVDQLNGAELPYKARVAEYVELTPRVRLGLWLAEKEGRDWESGGSVSLFEASGGGRWLVSEGTGPTLDAAIEDALSKVPKVPR
jgi:hypothetical protein